MLCVGIVQEEDEEEDADHVALGPPVPLPQRLRKT